MKSIGEKKFQNVNIDPNKIETTKKQNDLKNTPASACKNNKISTTKKQITFNPTVKHIPAVAYTPPNSIKLRYAPDTYIENVNPGSIYFSTSLNSAHYYNAYKGAMELLRIEPEAKIDLVIEDIDFGTLEKYGTVEKCGDDIKITVSKGHKISIEAWKNFPDIIVENE